MFRIKLPLFIFIFVIINTSVWAIESKQTETKVNIRMWEGIEIPKDNISSQNNKTLAELIIPSRKNKNIEKNSLHPINQCPVLLSFYSGKDDLLAKIDFVHEDCIYKDKIKSSLIDQTYIVEKSSYKVNFVKHSEAEQEMYHAPKQEWVIELTSGSHLTLKI
jgi:hypothetical protein